LKILFGVRVQKKKGGTPIRKTRVKKRGIKTGVDPSGNHALNFP